MQQNNENNNESELKSVDYHFDYKSNSNGFNLPFLTNINENDENA